MEAKNICFETILTHFRLQNICFETLKRIEPRESLKSCFLRPLQEAPYSQERKNRAKNTEKSLFVLKGYKRGRSNQLFSFLTDDNRRA